MPLIHTTRVMRRPEALLVRELDRGAPFRAARRYAGVSWWTVLGECLRGRARTEVAGARVARGSDSAFLLALAETRRRTGCDLGPILNRLVRPFEPRPSGPAYLPAPVLAPASAPPSPPPRWRRAFDGRQG
jgi:hypothetical protein